MRKPPIPVVGARACATTPRSRGRAVDLAGDVADILVSLQEAGPDIGLIGLPASVEQVRLLLVVLPDITGEDAIALKDGTAIYLFYRDPSSCEWCRRVR